MKIHHTAVIDSNAELDDSVSIGAYVVIEKGVKIGADTEISPHTIIAARTSIGQRNIISSFTTIGTPPQDLTYKGEPTRVSIGDDNQIREYVSIHRGTTHGREITTIGNDNMIMAYSHIAHDCLVGNHVIMANCATLGGHVSIDDHANLGGMIAIHQFSRVGCHSYIGGMSGIGKDVPPFVIVSGVRNKLRVSGINRVGLKRCGYDNDTIRNMSIVFGYIFRTPELLLNEALDKAAAEFPACEPVMTMIEFFKAPSRMGVVRKVNGDE